MGYQPSDLARGIMAYLDCPCQVFPPMQDDRPIWEAFQSAHAQAPQKGYTPVIVCVDDSLWESLCMSVTTTYKQGPNGQLLVEWGHGAPKPEQVAQYREKILAQPLIDGRAEFDRQIAKMDQELWDHAFSGPVAGGVEIDSFQAYLSYRSKGTNEVLLAQIPTPRPWEIFAWLPMGGWNDCPDTAGLMSAAELWYRLHGAVPACMSHDVLEFYVEKPVSGLETAKQLAVEHFLFCFDRVAQAGEHATVGSLADDLLKSNVWYFWWD